MKMTSNALHESLVEDLEKLLQHEQFENSRGELYDVQIFRQNLPIRKSNEELPPEIYVQVCLTGGKISTEQTAETFNVVLIICVCDKNENRQGYVDALHVKDVIYQHYAVHDIVGRKFHLLHPIEWEIPDDDAHPFYFLGMSMQFEASAPMVKEEFYG